MVKAIQGLTGRALRSRNYRLFFGGQSISLIGTWMTRLATSWLVYRLTDSALLLGIVGFAGQIPSLFLAPIAGVWVDRWNRHRTLVTMQILSMIQSFALAALALSGHINILAVILLAFLQGVINTLETPARQSFVIEMIEDRADLSNAIALNSSIVNGGRLVGPAIAGAVIAKVGEGYCFLIDGFSYIAVIASLLAMHVRPAVPRKEQKHAWLELKEGWSYVITSPAIRWILLMLGLVSFVGFPYTVLLPIMAGHVLHGGPNTLGLLTAATGVGALAAAVGLAMRSTVVGLGKWIGLASTILGLALILFGLSHVFLISMALMVLSGFGMMQQIATSNTILQTIVADDKRGRVMAFYTMAVFGLTPIGSLLAGSSAERVGAPATLIGAGVLCGFGGLFYRRKLPEIRHAIRPVYAQLGIIASQEPSPALPTPPEN